MKYQETHIHIKIECLQTKWDAALFWVKRKNPKGQWEKVLELIKSLIYVRVKRCA